jgi:hypothetical protein
MKLKIDYHLPRSQRPNWLLWFASLAESHWGGEHSKGDRHTVLVSLSSLLDEQTIVRRNSEYSGKMLRREITDDYKLVVYSSIGERPYLTISFVE